MIVKMKKLTLFIREANRRKAIEALRRLGVVHLKSLKQQQAPDINDITNKLEQAERTLNILNQYRHAADMRKEVSLKIEVQNKVEELLKFYEELKACEQEFDKAGQQLDQYRPWGGFNPDDIKAFSEKGISITLYQVNEREFQQVKDRSDVRVIRREKGYVYLAHITYKAGDTLPFAGVHMPEENFDSLCEKHIKLKKRIAEINTGLQSEAHTFKAIKNYHAVLEKKHQFLKAMYGMQEEQGFSYVQGYMPEDGHDNLVKLAEIYHAGYLLEEPDNADDVPTLIRNPRWIEIINPVLKFMNTVPGYAEYDISAWFLLFFSLFFAMLIGDAGYGIIFLLATFIMRKRFKHVPAQPFFLMYVLSLATIVWGAIRNMVWRRKHSAASFFKPPYHPKYQQLWHGQPEFNDIYLFYNRHYTLDDCTPDSGVEDSEFNQGAGGTRLDIGVVGPVFCRRHACDRKGNAGIYLLAYCGRYRAFAGFQRAAKKYFKSHRIIPYQYTA